MKTILTITCFLSMFIASAQWTTDTDVNTLVAESGDLGVQAEITSDGQTYVVYWKNVGAPTNIELRMQVMDADGNQTLGADGMLVSDQIPMGSFTVTMGTAVDAQDNLYIGVTGTGSGNPGFAFKLNKEGNHLWGANGVSIGEGFSVTPFPLTTGETIISWKESLGAYMQKYDASGNAVWSSAKPIDAGTGVTSPGNFFEISGGDFIAVFHQLLSGISSHLYAQRYDSNGDSVWQDAAQLSNKSTAFNRSYGGVQDGDVVYMGYFAATGTRFDSFLQRIDPDGTLPWGINGSDFDTSQTNNEMSTQIAFETGSQYIYAVAFYTNSLQSEIGGYVQKFDKTSGAREFSDNAKVVFPIGGNQAHSGPLHLRNGSPFFLMQEGENNGAAPSTLNAVYLDENGDFVWPEETRPMATFPAPKSRVHFTKEVAMQNVAIFAEDKGNGMKIYAQNIVDETASIEDFSTTNVSFANPVKNEMLIKSNNAIKAISVYNILGQEIVNTKFYGKNEVSINTQNWTSGIYLMNVSTNEGAKNGIKLIKQ